MKGFFRSLFRRKLHTGGIIRAGRLQLSSRLEEIR